MGMTNFEGLAFTTGLYVGKSGQETQLINSSGSFVNPLPLTGNVTIGDASADTLTVNATSTFKAPVTFQNSAGTTVGKYVASGLWTLGSTATTVTHLMEGSINVKNQVSVGNDLMLGGDGGADTRYQIFMGATAAELSLSGSTGQSAGAVLRLFGSAHSTPNIMRFCTGTTIQGSKSSAGLWTLGSTASTVTHAINGSLSLTDSLNVGNDLKIGNDATSATRYQIFNGVPDGELSISGSTGQSDGAVLRLFGGSHATLADVAQFCNGTIVQGSKSAVGLWTLGSAASTVTHAVNGAASLTKYIELSNAGGDPGAVVDGARIGSVDISAGNASLAIRTETAVVSETVVSDRTLAVQINGTTYKICLKV